MPKDPAMLWYWSDWGGGTKTFSRHLKGCYMDLLEAQFNAGPLSLEEIRTVLGTDFGQWPALQKKFTLTDGGLYFNERMELEKAKRKKFTESRRSNLESKKHPHMDAHMGQHKDTHMDNRNINRDGFIKEGGTGETKQPIIQAMTDIWMELKNDYPFDKNTDGHALYDIGEFLAKQLQGKWIPETDVGYMAILESWRRLAKWLVADDFYKSFSLGSVARTKNIQTIWQKSKETKNGTAAKPTASGNRKNAGTEELIASLNEDLGVNPG